MSAKSHDAAWRSLCEALLSGFSKKFTCRLPECMRCNILLVDRVSHESLSPERVAFAVVGVMTLAAVVAIAALDDA